MPPPARARSPEPPPPPPPAYPPALESLVHRGYADPALLRDLSKPAQALVETLLSELTNAEAAEQPTAPNAGPDLAELVVRLTEELNACKDAAEETKAANRALLHELATALDNSRASAHIQDLERQVAQLQAALADASSDEPARLVIAQVVQRANKLEEELRAAREATRMAQHECERLAGVSQSALSEKQKLEAALNDEVLAKDRALEMQARLQRRVDEEHDRAAQLESELDKCKVDLASVSGSRTGLQQRLKDAHAATERERSLRKQAEQATAQANEETRAIHALRVQDQRVAKELQGKLQAMEEELKVARRERAAAEAASQEAIAARVQVEQRVGALSRQVQGQAAALAARDNDVHALESKLDTVTSNLEQEHKAHEKRREEVRAAAHDVATMTRENQALHTALETMRRDRDAARAQAQEASARALREADLLERAKTERADVQAVYKQSCDEVARLSAALREAAESRSSALEQARGEREAKAEVTRRLALSEDAARLLRVDVQNCENQVADLSAQLRAAKAEIKMLREDVAVTKQHREHAASTTRSRERDLSRREIDLAQVQGERDALGARLAEVVRENEALLGALEAERRKTEEMRAAVGRATTNQALALISAGTPRTTAPTPPSATPAGARTTPGTATGGTTAAAAVAAGAAKSPTTGSAASSTRPDARQQEQFRMHERVARGGGDQASSDVASALSLGREERRRIERMFSPGASPDT